ncbi:leucine-rich repeat-containing protein 23-like isoform X2 [Mytilus edulis]|uniref:leucine-rich repeat-containing protein 23-like isoform X2 n=1 Tax=Mytilus edulis TaxID=6550 RepID=UPI0039F0AE13
MSDNEAEETFGEEEDNAEEAGGEEGDEEVLGEEEEKLGEEEEVEEEEKVPDLALTEEHIAECLSLLCKTGDGLAHAYVRLDVHDRQLTDINILKSFIHLRYLDLSKNNLKDISCLSALTHLLTLKADYNLLTTVKLEEMPFLQVASFNDNKMKTLEGCSHPMLEHLSVNNNLISKVDTLEPAKLARLHTLELRGNKLTTTDGFCLPNLKNLFLAQNVITVIEGLDRMSSLTTLHMRGNQVKTLDGFTDGLQMLQYINLRENSVMEVKTEVPKLQCLPLLRAMVLSENPCTEEDDYRIEVLIALRKLERLDKEEYQEEERTEAEAIAEQRKEEEANAENKEDTQQEGD